jgi:hypothetical protein
MKERRPPPADLRDLRETVLDLADRAAWDDLAALFRTCDEAVHRAPPAGREAADARIARDHAVLALAVDGPAHLAAPAVLRHYQDRQPHSPARWEQLAQRPWAELDAYLPDGPTPQHRELRHLIAHSRVLRGEDLSGAPGLDPAVLSGVPFALRPWEAQHWNPRRMTSSNRRGAGSGSIAAFPPDNLPTTVPLPAPAPPEHIRPATSRTAEVCPLADSDESALIRGDAWTGAGTRASRAPNPRPTGAETPFELACPELLLAASGSAAYTGTVSESQGRIRLWRLLAEIGDLSEPHHPPAVDALVASLRCVTWHEPTDEIWYLHLAVENPARDLTWVLNGADYD